MPFQIVLSSKFMAHAAGSVPDRDNFTTEDLLEKRNIRQVVLCTCLFRTCAAAEGLLCRKLYVRDVGLPGSRVCARLVPTPGLTAFFNWRR
jgi:hypothetical protein